MKHRLFLVIALVAALALTACGGQGNTEQAVMDMPTPIPTYTPQTESIASQGNAPAIEAETSEAAANADQGEEAAVVAHESETPEAEVSATEEPTVEATPVEEETPVSETPEAEASATEEPTVEATPVEEETPVSETPEAEVSATEKPTVEATPVEEETPVSETPEVEVSATEEPTVEATPAEEETPEAGTAPDDPLAGLPEGVAAAMADADPNRGEQLTMQNACTGCHSLDPNASMVGPTWDNLAETAASRVEGQSAAEYLYHSITDPNAYVVEGFPPDVMLQNYADTLSDQDLADIIAYLLNPNQ